MIDDVKIGSAGRYPVFFLEGQGMLITPSEIVVDAGFWGERELYSNLLQECFQKKPAPDAPTV